MSKKYLSSLSNDAIYEYMMSLSLKDILDLRFVSKRLNKLITDDRFWCKLLKKRYNIDKTLNCFSEFKKQSNNIYIYFLYINGYVKAVYKSLNNAYKGMKEYYNDNSKNDIYVTLVQEGNIRSTAIPYLNDAKTNYKIVKDDKDYKQFENMIYYGKYIYLVTDINDNIKWFRNLPKNLKKDNCVRKMRFYDGISVFSNTGDKYSIDF